MAKTSLTKPEQTELGELEKTIEHGLGTFVEVGLALRVIRDKGLYRAHGTFGDYCKRRWGMTGRRGYQLVDAAEVIENVNNCSQKLPSLPANEGQARELVPIPREKRGAVWQQAIDKAPEEGITARHVKAVVEEWLKASDETTSVPVETCTVKDLAKLTVEVAEGIRPPYRTVYADPPWKYGNQATRSATDNEYPTLTVDEICELPVVGLADEEAHLHLWTTNAFLFEAKRVIDAWGFEYKSCFVWVKSQMGIGNYWRVSHEFLLLGVRGGLRFRDKGQMSWIEVPRGEHSAKPEQIRERLELVSLPPYLELFARRQIPGWSAWGNEVERDLLTSAETI